MKWPAGILCGSTLVHIWLFNIASVAVWAHLVFCCGASPQYIPSNHYITYTCVSTVFPPPFNEFYHFGCKNIIDFHPGHFCPVWNKKTNKQTNQKKQYTGWRTNKCFTGGVSAVAPVDVFQQDCHKINNANLSAQRDRWPQVLGVCVCVLSLSFQLRTVSLLYDDEQRLQPLENALLLLLLLGFLVMTSYLGIITWLLKVLFFFAPPLSMLMCSRAPQGAQPAWGNAPAFCGAELKGFTLHHFKPHFQPLHCCLHAAGERNIH